MKLYSIFFSYEIVVTSIYRTPCIHTYIHYGIPQEYYSLNVSSLISLVQKYPLSQFPRLKIGFYSRRMVTQLPLLFFFLFPFFLSLFLFCSFSFSFISSRRKISKRTWLETYHFSSSFCFFDENEEIRSKVTRGLVGESIQSFDVLTLSFYLSIYPFLSFSRS